MKKIFYTLFFLSGFCFSQRTVFSEGHLKRWDGYKNGVFRWWDTANFRGTFPFDEGLIYYNAFKESKNSRAFYEVGYGQIEPRLRVFQASGRPSDFDEILNLIEPSLLNGEPADKYYRRTGISLGGYLTPNDTYNSWFNEPMYDSDGSVFTQTRTEYLEYYTNNLGSTYGIAGVQVANNNIGAQYALWENIYMRFVANAMRIAYKYPSFLDMISGDGITTYRQRCEAIVRILEKDVWEKWFSRNLDHYVYRVNKHMASHLAMVGLCLYSITGKREYFDFTWSYFHDFSKHPNGTPSSEIGDGENFWTGMTVVSMGEKGDRYEYSMNWKKGNYTYQDISHAGGGEAHLIYAAWQEDIYGITKYQMDTYLNSIKYGWVDYPTFKSTGERLTYFRCNQTKKFSAVESGGGNQAIFLWAEYDKSGELLEWLEGLKVNAASTWKGANSAFAYYASKSLENDLVYPSKQ